MHSSNIQINAPLNDTQKEILSPEAIKFIEILHQTFNPRRLDLLLARKERQLKVQNSQMQLHFLKETIKIRQDPTWKVASLAPGLIDRRVEITGPPERKMTINALNSGANCFMADFEDSSSPTWINMIDGQINLRDALKRTINFNNPDGKKYQLHDQIATLLVRPRGWHLEEKHVKINGENCSASLFDFGLYFFHNAKTTLQVGQGPYFYLPKMESYLEARLWNDVFNFSQDYLGLKRGTIRATVLIETIWAAYEMEEILYELREHSSGLNCGRWDYIFSFIKVFKNDSSKLLSDRKLITMGPETKFMNNYVKLLIHTCHKRGAHAMGGMAARIPVKDNKEANDLAMNKVTDDKKREVLAGHDGTWVAHPALVKLAKDIFDKYMPTPNQLYRQSKPSSQIHQVGTESNYYLSTTENPEGICINEEELVNCKPFNLPNNEPQITEEGIRINIKIALMYMESWVSGLGCVPIMGLMEDAATAEISRVQLWHWVKHGAKLSSKGKMEERVTQDLVKKIMNEEYEQLYKSSQHKENLKLVKGLLEKEVYGELSDFLTSLAYDYIIEKSSPKL